MKLSRKGMNSFEEKMASWISHASSTRYEIVSNGPISYAFKTALVLLENKVHCAQNYAWQLNLW